MDVTKPYEFIGFGVTETQDRNYAVSFGCFGPVSGQTWPRNPLQRGTLDKRCRMRLKSTPTGQNRPGSGPADSEPEGNLAGLFGGAFLKSGRLRGPGKTLKNVGGFAPHVFEGFPSPRRRPDLKSAPQKVRPDCPQVPSRRASSAAKVPPSHVGYRYKDTSGQPALFLFCLLRSISPTHRHTAKTCRRPVRTRSRESS
jgi:hypothetical protein